MRRSLLVTLVAGLAVVAAGCRSANDDQLRIGLLPECRSYSASAFQPLIAAAELPLIERGAHKSGDDPSDGLDGARIAGRAVELEVGCEAAETHPFDSVYSFLEVRRLVEREGADVVILSTGEPWTIELHEYARRHPAVTFVIGWGYTQSATLRGAPANVISFFPNVLQQVAVAGAYAYNELGWRRAVIVHDDHAWGRSEAAGFATVFCALGGTVVDRVWIPLTAPFDPAAIAARVRRDAPDGIFLGNGDLRVVTALADGVPALRGNMAEELVGTWWSLGDNSIHLALGRRLEGVLTTMAGSPPFGDSNPENARYWKRYTATFPGQSALWALHGGGTATYTSMLGVIAALEAVDGRLGEGSRAFQRALRDVDFEGPTGRVRLDEHGQVIATAWTTRRAVARGERADVPGLPPVEGIEQTLGGLLGPESAPPSRTGPACRRGDPPAWAPGVGG